MRDLRLPRRWRRPSPLLPSSRPRRSLRIPFILSRRLLLLLFVLAALALAPPVFFHFRLRRFHHMRAKKCGWIERPPLVCAHGGDSSKGSPNTMAAYKYALDSRVDCIEIDVSRSFDGVLVALHDRDLQRMSGNSTAKVGHMRMDEIKQLDAALQVEKDFLKQEVPTIEDALKFVSRSVKQVILDAKVGPPSYEKGLAEDILTVVSRTHCSNCVVWAKSDVLSRDVIRLTQDIKVGYIVMVDPVTGLRSNLLRIKGADIVGVSYLLIDRQLVRSLHVEGKKVYAWTVDDAESMRRMLFEHVDAIVTGNPSLLQSLMQELKTECIEEGFPLP